MKWITFPIVLAIAILSGGSFAQDEATAKAQAQIISLEKAWNQAYKLRDTKALSTLLDSSVVLVQDDGSLQTRSEFLAAVKSSTANEEQVAPESLAVRIFGDTAIAVGVLAAKGSKGGKPYVRRERFVDTWIRKGSSWVCVATNATPILH
jgi:ketosteroid isomerase-like protein